MQRYRLFVILLKSELFTNLLNLTLITKYILFLNSILNKILIYLITFFLSEKRFRYDILNFNTLLKFLSNLLSSITVIYKINIFDSYKILFTEL